MPRPLSRAEPSRATRTTRPQYRRAILQSTILQRMRPHRLAECSAVLLIVAGRIGKAALRHKWNRALSRMSLQLSRLIAVWKSTCAPSGERTANILLIVDGIEALLR